MVRRARGQDHPPRASAGRRRPRPPSGWTGGDAIVTDGPFVEGKEVVSGYTEIEVADLDEALRMVKTWPACPIVGDPAGDDR